MVQQSSLTKFVHKIWRILPILTSEIQFYSWYIYPEHKSDYGKSISSAEFIDDVDQVTRTAILIAPRID